MGEDVANAVTTVDEVELDLTKGADYQRLVDEEIQHYSGIEVTQNLTEGGVHDSKAWTFNYHFHYKNIFKTDPYNEVVTFANQRENPGILSIGCGYGGHELQIARSLRQPYHLVALDLNSLLFREAQRRAASEGLNVRFKCVDLNFLDIEPASFDVIYAIASIHHVLNLEHLFATIHRGLKDQGRLVMLDIIGQSQVLHWKQNVEFAAELVRKMPWRYMPLNTSLWRKLARRFDPYTIIPEYVEPSEQIGMEGIRQEEIEPLLGQWFTGEKVFRYNAFMRLICTNPYLGKRLDPAVEKDRLYLEDLIRLDYEQVQSGKLRPTELFGVFVKR
ncbi:MAG TPA: class I SAM-dependent methyltransferase [Isosphaeraceae bacterium]|nr:class I SAM-dependent methyltransferase [Isosphaeraceae bacterium]